MDEFTRIKHVHYRPRFWIGVGNALKTQVHVIRTIFFHREFQITHLTVYQFINTNQRVSSRIIAVPHFKALLHSQSI